MFTLILIQMEKKYDAIVIGSGQGGNPLAKKLAAKGWKTALVEKRNVGGTCVNDGCTPTKALVASAKMAEQTRNSEVLGIITNHHRLDIESVIGRKNDIVKLFRESAEKSLRETSNLDLIFGKAAFTGIKKIEVKTADNQALSLSADYFFINTGTTTAVPEIDGLHEVPFLTSTTILDVQQIPDHLLIIGGGPISLEFAQMFRRFGAEVTIVEQGTSLVAREDDDIIEEITSIFKEEGINIYTDAKVEQLKKTSGGIFAGINAGENVQQVSCSHVLIAAGKTPNTADLNLSKTKVETDVKGYVKVNEKLETDMEGIYALGDVKGGPAFTHVSYHDHLVVAKNLLEKGNESINGRLLPYCIFTDPQLGRVGLNEKQARAAGRKIKLAKMPAKHAARAIETGETKGLMKVIIDADTHKILGASILSSQGGEIMSVIQMAMMGDISYEVIRDSMFAHPTFAESLNNLFMTVE